MTDRSADPESIDIACSLDGAGQVARGAEWSTLLARSLGHDWDGMRLRLSFAADPTLAAEIARLAVLEQQCCPFFAFTLTVATDALTLDVHAPPDAHALVHELFARSG